MLSNKLINELGLLRLVPKQNAVSDLTVEQPVVQEVIETSEATSNINNDKLDKHEFRLLVKMLQAIDHECQYDHMEYDGSVVKYQLPSITLVFGDINNPDNDDTMNLSSLADIIANPALKRPVWEKLKQLK